MKYKNLIFDYGGVLADLNRETCVAAFHAIGIDDIDRLLDPCHQRGIFHGIDEGTATYDEFHAELRRHATRPVTDKQIDDAWCSFLEGIPHYKLDALLELKQTYHLILLSNISLLHWNYTCAHHFAYNGHTVGDYFHHLYLSFQEKTTKPDLRIFRRMIADSGINPGETLFLDDSDLNCQAAESLGIDTYMPKAREDWRPVVRRLVNDEG